MKWKEHEWLVARTRMCDWIYDASHSNRSVFDTLNENGSIDYLTRMFLEGKMIRLQWIGEYFVCDVLEKN